MIKNLLIKGDVCKQFYLVWGKSFLEFEMLDADDLMNEQQLIKFEFDLENEKDIKSLQDLVSCLQNLLPKKRRTWECACGCVNILSPEADLDFTQCYECDRFMIP